MARTLQPDSAIKTELKRYILHGGYNHWDSHCPRTVSSGLGDTIVPSCGVLKVFLIWAEVNIIIISLIRLSAGHINQNNSTVDILTAAERFLSLYDDQMKVSKRNELLSVAQPMALYRSRLAMLIPSPRNSHPPYTTEESYFAEQVAMQPSHHSHSPTRTVLGLSLLQPGLTYHADPKDK